MGRATRLVLHIDSGYEGPLSGKENSGVDMRCSAGIGYRAYGPEEIPTLRVGNGVAVVLLLHVDHEARL